MITFKWDGGKIEKRVRRAKNSTLSGYEREDENIKVGISNMPEEFLTKYRKQGGTGHYTKGMKMLCYYDNNGKAKIPFSRILIRNKHPEPPKGGHQ